MNPAIYNITLDIHKTGSQVFLSMLRGDTKRVIVVSLTENGKPYIITQECTAMFTAVKPDGNFIYNDCKIDYENNTIVYSVTSQTTAENGMVNCQIKLIGNDGGVITSPTFSLVVSNTVYNEEPIVESSEEFKALTAYIADLQQRVANGEFNGKDAVTDQTYNPVSENAQSGKAVAEAVSGKMDKFGTVYTDDGGYPTVVAKEASLEIGHIDATLIGVTNLSVSNSLQTPEPQGDYGATNKRYVDDSKKTVLSYADNTFSPAIRNTVSGTAVAVNDVSPVEHDLDIKLTGKNLLPYPYAETTKTYNGITFTDNGDGTVTVDGATEGSYAAVFSFCDNNTEIIETVKASGATDFCISIDGLDSTVMGDIYLYDSYGDLLHNTTASSTIHLNDYPTLYKISISLLIPPLGYSYDNMILKPQIEIGSTATEYAPYIGDFSGVRVSRYGKNLIPYPYTNTTKTINGVTFTDNGDGTITANGTATANADFDLSTMINIKKGVIISSGTVDDSLTTYEVFVNGMDGTIMRSFSDSIATHDFVASRILVRIRPGVTVNNLVFKPQLEIGTTATEYEPYTEPQTVTANTDGTTEGITSLSPNMTVITDTDGVELNLTYNVDTKLYIDNKFAELSAAILNS